MCSTAYMNWPLPVYSTSYRNWPIPVNSTVYRNWPLSVYSTAYRKCPLPVCSTAYRKCPLTVCSIVFMGCPLPVYPDYAITYHAVCMWYDGMLYIGGAVWCNDNIYVSLTLPEPIHQQSDTPISYLYVTYHYLSFVLLKWNELQRCMDIHGLIGSLVF